MSDFVAIYEKKEPGTISDVMVTGGIYTNSRGSLFWPDYGSASETQSMLLSIVDVPHKGKVRGIPKISSTTPENTLE